MHDSMERTEAAADLASLFYTGDSTAAQKRDVERIQGPGPLESKGSIQPDQEDGCDTLWPSGEPRFLLAQLTINPSIDCLQQIASLISRAVSPRSTLWLSLRDLRTKL